MILPNHGIPILERFVFVVYDSSQCFHPFLFRHFIILFIYFVIILSYYAFVVHRLV